MYISHFGLKERPFFMAPNPAYLYRSARHTEALDHLEFGLQEGYGLIVLTGGIGTGKTLLLNHLIQEMKDRANTAFIPNSNISGHDLIQIFMQEVGLHPEKGDKAHNTIKVHDFLEAQVEQGLSTVLIVDDAQCLPHDALNEVSMLSNLYSRNGPLVYIILSGQTNLLAKLREPALAHLLQRINVSFHLGDLDKSEMNLFIRHRLQAAGACRLDLFQPDALACIFAYSKGNPRIINRLADASLLAGYVVGCESIDKSTVLKVLQEWKSTPMDVGHGLEDLLENPDLETEEFEAEPSEGVAENTGTAPGESSSADPHAESHDPATLSFDDSATAGDIQTDRSSVYDIFVGESAQEHPPTETSFYGLFLQGDVQGESPSDKVQKETPRHPELPKNGGEQPWPGREGLQKPSNPPQQEDGSRKVSALLAAAKKESGNESSQISKKPHDTPRGPKKSGFNASARKDKDTRNHGPSEPGGEQVQFFSRKTVLMLSMIAVGVVILQVGFILWATG